MNDSPDCLDHRLCQGAPSHGETSRVATGRRDALRRSHDLRVRVCSVIIGQLAWRRNFEGSVSGCINENIPNTTLHHVHLLSFDKICQFVHSESGISFHSCIHVQSGTLSRWNCFCMATPLAAQQKEPFLTFSTDLSEVSLEDSYNCITFHSSFSISSIFL